MKKAVFITNGSAGKYRWENPWAQGHVFNSRSMELPGGEGLMLFRRDFCVEPGMTGVILRATALGVFDLYVDGCRVGTPVDGGVRYEELKPEWTDYRYRVMEYEYDLLPFCRGEGNHTLIVSVSAGWWAGRISLSQYHAETCAFCGELEFRYDDGRKRLDASRPGWLTGIGGKIRTADIWDGEYYDARIPDPSQFPDTVVWEEAVPFTEFSGTVIPLMGTPLRVRPALTQAPQSAEVYETVETDGTEYGRILVRECAKGPGCEARVLRRGEHLILDMGQNMVGWPSLHLRGAAGTKVTVCVAEMRNDSGDASRGNDGPSGSLYLKNYRSALARVVYVCSGEGEESYAPSHTYYGFRYLELTTDADVEILCVRGLVVGSDLRETGWLETSHPEVNRLFSNIVWGMRGNYFSNPTDCPQRDERLGWTGDAQIFCGAGTYLADTRDFMRKWMGDVRCSQIASNGGVCDVVPAVLPGYNNAAWGDAAVLIPYRMWLMYQDEALLAEHFSAMEDYMTSLEKNGLDGPNIAYGDWLNYEVTDKRYIAVCYYALDAAVMETCANVLACTETKYETAVAHYHRLRERIVAHFREQYLRDDGELRVTTQTGYLLALYCHMVEGEVAECCRRRLREKIEGNAYTLSTGFVGTGILNQTLSREGMTDLAYSLLLQTADPSWLYSVEQGATTVWERWNSYTIADGFGDVGMNSFNHYAYGAVAEWMFADMAGIAPDPEHPGFRQFLLCPKPDMRSPREIPEGQEPIRWVRAGYDSHCGKIESAWRKEGQEVEYTFSVPEGTRARVILSRTATPLEPRVNGAPAKNLVTDGRNWIFVLGAGTYDVR